MQDTSDVRYYNTGAVQDLHSLEGKVERQQKQIEALEDRIKILEKKNQELVWIADSLGLRSAGVADCLNKRVQAIWEFLGAPMDDPAKFIEWRNANTKSVKGKESVNGGEGTTA